MNGTSLPRVIPYHSSSFQIAEANSIGAYGIRQGLWHLSAQVTELLINRGAGDETSRDQLVPMVHEELRGLARPVGPCRLISGLTG